MTKVEQQTAQEEAQISDIPNTPLRFLWYLGKKYQVLGIVSFALVITAETLNVLILYVSAQLVDGFTLAETLAAQQEALVFLG